MCVCISHLARIHYAAVEIELHRCVSSGVLVETRWLIRFETKHRRITTSSDDVTITKCVVHEGLLNVVIIRSSSPIFILKIDLGSDSVEVEQPADFNLVDLEAVVGLLSPASIGISVRVRGIYKAFERKEFVNNDFTHRKARGCKKCRCDSNFVFHSLFCFVCFVCFVSRNKQRSSIEPLCLL